MRPSRALILAFALAAAPLSAGTAAAQAEKQPEAQIGAPGAGQAAARAQNDYESCLALAQRDPFVAREAAARWRAMGGGAQASHCAAIALIGQGAELQAAAILTDIGSSPTSGLAAPERVSMLKLAGSLWLRQGRDDLAEQCFDAALGMAPNDRDALVGSARAHGLLGDYETAVERLDVALQTSPLDPEALTLRAAARRRTGDSLGALEDAQAAVQAAPGSPMAWLEKGSAHRALGDDSAARQAWLQAATLDLAGPAGDEARYALQRLDGG